MIPEPVAIQFWSHEGLTPENRAKIEAILKERGDAICQPTSTTKKEISGQSSTKGLPSSAAPKFDPEGAADNPRIKQTPQGIWVLRDDTAISRWIEQHDSLQHDFQTLPEVLSHLNPGDWVVDAGAFCGDTAEPFLQCIGVSGVLFAFEPHPDAFECLRRNLEAYSNAECYPVALSDMDATVPFEIDPNAGASRISSKETGQTITTQSLDYYGLKRVDFIKLDVEGMEPRVLRGAAQTIAKFRPKMLIEVNHGALRRQGFTAEDIYSFLRQHSYEWREVVPSPEQPQNTPQTDILCTPLPLDENPDRDSQLSTINSQLIPWRDKPETLAYLFTLATEIRRFCDAPRHTQQVYQVLKRAGVNISAPKQKRRKHPHRSARSSS